MVESQENGTTILLGIKDRQIGEVVGGDDKSAQLPKVRWTPSLGKDRGCIKIGSRYPRGIWC